MQNTQQRMAVMVIQRRRHVLAEDLKFLCPYAGRHLECVWSDGTDCTVTTEHAKDCPLNEPDDAAACEESALSISRNQLPPAEADGLQVRLQSPRRLPVRALGNPDADPIATSNGQGGYREGPPDRAGGPNGPNWTRRALGHAKRPQAGHPAGQEKCAGSQAKMLTDSERHLLRCTPWNATRITAII